MLGWLKRLAGWEEEAEEERWDLSVLNEEEIERYKALLADGKAYAYMNWEEFREYIRSQGLPPPPPLKKRRAIGF